MIALTVEGAHAHGKWVGVCGALASDLAAVPVLVGLGVDELSVSVPAIASVKAALSRLDFEDCRALARRVLPSAARRACGRPWPRADARDRPWGRRRRSRSHRAAGDGHEFSIVFFKSSWLIREALSRHFVLRVNPFFLVMLLMLIKMISIFVL